MLMFILSLKLMTTLRYSGLQTRTKPFIEIVINLRQTVYFVLMWYVFVNMLHLHLMRCSLDSLTETLLGGGQVHTCILHTSLLLQRIPKQAVMPLLVMMSRSNSQVSYVIVFKSRIRPILTAVDCLKNYKLNNDSINDGFLMDWKLHLWNHQDAVKNWRCCLMRQLLIQNFQV